MAGADVYIDTARLRPLLEILGAFQQPRQCQRLRAVLSDLTDRELIDIGTTRFRSTTSPPRYRPARYPEWDDPLI
ncbi:DUF1127 domain-containing protein [uncultured Bradyrhizobium sp.]|uniref:DUF1127 domain-containing protein n=1 Tax=Bradyrhizobium sp. TaxID=376 RepID=UPI00260261D0|nr:DUF1127 domain-containing protein [uncultured Bradyrhizobium sp.]